MTNRNRYECTEKSKIFNLFICSIMQPGPLNYLTTKYVDTAAKSAVSSQSGTSHR
jgi:hypothetical protein